MATSMSSKLTTKLPDQAQPAAATSSTEVKPLTEEQKKKIGAEDLEAVLNRASDPNWVDTSRKVKGHGDSSLDKDAFFKLMMTQMKYQDPMNPLKNHEMAAQLAQFSTLEQMSNMNTTLQKIEGKNNDPQQFQALNLIGKVVAGDSSKVVRGQFDKVHDFNFNAPQELSEANIKILNAKGEEIRNIKLNNIQPGANKITWNGMTEAGDSAPAGDYKFSIEATGKTGQKVLVKTEFEGQITGLTFTAEGPVLQVGSQSIKMRDVRQITDSSAKPLDQNVKDLTSTDLKNADGTKQTNIKKEANTSANAKAAPAGASDIMTNVAMSRELMNQLQQPAPTTANATTDSTGESEVK